MIARLVWLVGIVSVISAASPAFQDRADFVAELVPRVFPAAATTGTLAAGVMLMVVANGLRRGKFRAWVLATVLTAFATVAHLVKGLDVEEAVLTAAVFLLLVTSHRRFRALPDPRSPRRILALIGFGVPIATTFAVLKHRLYDIDVVIRRTLIYGTLTATLGAAYVGSVLLLQPLLSPSSDLAIAGKDRNYIESMAAPLFRMKIERPGGG